MGLLTVRSSARKAKLHGMNMAMDGMNAANGEFNGTTNSASVVLQDFQEGDKCRFVVY